MTNHDTNEPPDSAPALTNDERDLLRRLDRDSETCVSWGTIFGVGHPPLRRQFTEETYHRLCQRGFLQPSPGCDEVEWEISNAGQAALRGKSIAVPSMTPDTAPVDATIRARYERIPSYMRGVAYDDVMTLLRIVADLRAERDELASRAVAADERYNRLAKVVNVSRGVPDTFDDGWNDPAMDVYDEPTSGAVHTTPGASQDGD